MDYLRSETDRATEGLQCLPSMRFKNQPSNLEKSELVAGRKKNERGAPEMKWQMEVGRVVKQKNVTPDDAVKG